jgi:hypothetical protein
VVVNAFAMSHDEARLVDYDTYIAVLRNLVMTGFCWRRRSAGPK